MAFGTIPEAHGLPLHNEMPLMSRINSALPIFSVPLMGDREARQSLSLPRILPGNGSMPPPGCLMFIHGSHSCHNHYTFRCMDFVSVTINAIVTDAPDKHLSAVVTASIPFSNWRFFTMRSTRLILDFTSHTPREAPIPISDPASPNRRYTPLHQLQHGSLSFV